MNYFITGTDTDIGKTLVSSWLCLHTNYAYFKPIQTGSIHNTDSQTVANLAGVKIYPESYLFKDPVSPHLASQRTNTQIDLLDIKLPQKSNLIIEGAGGLLTPINKQHSMIDLIKQTQAYVILVCSSRVGTINHTLLSLEALRARSISNVGVIMSGNVNMDNIQAIEYYGNVNILGLLPFLNSINNRVLLNYPLPQKLNELLGEKK